MIYLLYLLVAIGLTYPVITTLSTEFIGWDNGDAYEQARHAWWFKTAIQNGEDIFWQSALAYPDGFSGVSLWANPLQFFPMWVLAFVMPLAAAYNVTLLLGMALNGWAMYFLARNHFGHHHHTPAIITGLIYMVFPVFQGHAFDGHAGLIMQWGAPLLVYALFEYIDSGRKRWFGLSVIFFVLSVGGNALQVLYFLLPLMAFVLFTLLFKRNLIGVTRVITVSIIGSLVLLVYLFPAISDTLQFQRYIVSEGYVRDSIDLLGIVSPSFRNTFWSNIMQYPTLVLGDNLAEGSSYIGIIALALAFIGGLSTHKSRWWILVAIASWLLALGPVVKIFDQPVLIDIAGYDAVVPMPYALFINLPLFELAHTPGRFMFLFALAFAMLAGYGMTYIWESGWVRNSRKVMRYLAVIVLGYLIFRDYQFFEPFPTHTATIPQAMVDLADRNDIRAVFNVPYDDPLASKEALYLQTAHHKDLIGGHVSREAPIDPAMLELLSTFEAPLLTDAGADIVIIHKRSAQNSGMLETLSTRALIHLGSPIYEDDRYAIYETPITTAEPYTLYTTSPNDHQEVTYIYKEQPGWLEYTATFNADNRRMNLLLNGEKLDTWTIDGTQRLSIPLPIGRRGYNTFSIEFDPPCPQRYNETLLVCRGVEISDVEIVAFTDGPIYDPIRIEDGIELASFYMSEDFANNPDVRLWWRFDNPRAKTDVRFIHVLDENRRLMAQADDSIGDINGDTQWTETVHLDISDLPAGDYIVLAGWYALPDAIRYDVLTNVEGAQDNTIVLGSFTIEESN
jgi:hypothetical protein